jgi:hypothetical protein
MRILMRLAEHQDEPTARMAWKIQVRKKTRMTKTRYARFVFGAAASVALLILDQEGAGFIADEDEDEDEVSRKERRRRKKRKNREEEEGLDEDDMDLIGLPVESRETQPVGPRCALSLRG